MQIAPLIEMFSLTLLFGGSCALLAKKCSLPITLGYMAGGILIGPFGPLASHLHSTGTAPVKTLAEIGILLLMFSLGLEVDIAKFALACQARDSILESSHSSEALQDCELTSFVTSAAHPFCGKTLMELRIREKFHCTILGVGRGEERIKNPPSDFLLQNEDIIYAVGSRIQIEKMKRGEI